MSLKLAGILAAVVILACGTDSVSRSQAPKGSTAVSRANESGSSNLPAPKVRVSFEQKYIRSFPFGHDGKGKRQFSYQVVDQWVLHPDAAEARDETLICVGDGNHCIELWRLEEQLNRPANDPLDVRHNNKQ